MARAPQFFRSAWGPVELWIADITTDEGRDLAIQKYTTGNTPNVQNRGGSSKTARCALLFDDMEGAKESGKERVLSMIALKELGKAQLFIHPLLGTYLAEIEQFETRIDAGGVISGSATFIATEEVGAAFADPLGISLDVDASALDTALADLLSQLESSDPSLLARATVPAALAKARDIFDTASSARESLVALSDISERIGQEMDDLQLASDIALWPVMKAYVIAGSAASEAAKAATGDQGDLMTMRVNSPISLRRLCAELYGAVDAAAGYSDAITMNDIPTPARIPAGTVLRLRQPKRLAKAA